MRWTPNPSQISTWEHFPNYGPARQQWSHWQRKQKSEFRTAKGQLKIEFWGQGIRHLSLWSDTKLLMLRATGLAEDNDWETERNEDHTGYTAERCWSSKQTLLNSPDTNMTKISIHRSTEFSEQSKKNIQKPHLGSSWLKCLQQNTKKKVLEQQR